MGKTFKRNHDDGHKKIHRIKDSSQKRKHFEVEDFENKNFNKQIMEYEYEKKDFEEGFSQKSF